MDLSLLVKAKALLDKGLALFGKAKAWALANKKLAIGLAVAAAVVVLKAC